MASTWAPKRTPTRSTGGCGRGYGALMTQAYAAACPLVFNLQRDAHRSFRKARADRDLAGHADRRQGDRHRAGETNLIADEAIRFHPALPAKLDAARGLPLGLADKVMLALDEPEALPKDGSLRGAAVRTAMGSCSSAPVRPALHRGLLRRKTWRKRLEDAGDGAHGGAGHRRDRGLLGFGFPRRLKPLVGVALGP